MQNWTRKTYTWLIGTIGFLAILYLGVCYLLKKQDTISVDLSLGTISLGSPLESLHRVRSAKLVTDSSGR